MIPPVPVQVELVAVSSVTSVGFVAGTGSPSTGSGRAVGSSGPAQGGRARVQRPGQTTRQTSGRADGINSSQADADEVRGVDPDVAAARTPIDAERAYAAKAARDGTWPAFRAFAEDDATMFVPRPVNAQTYLARRKEQSWALDWWPTASWEACDGSYAINTGGWRRPKGSVGFFTTVWRHQPETIGGWRWTVDSGGPLAEARPRVEQPTVTRASCEGQPPELRLERSEPGVEESVGSSFDGTLRWHWQVDRSGARMFQAWLWDGMGYRRIIADGVAPHEP